MLRLPDNAPSQGWGGTDSRLTEIPWILVPGEEEENAISPV